MDADQLGFGQSNKLDHSSSTIAGQEGLNHAELRMLFSASELRARRGAFPRGARARASAHCGWRMNRVDDGIGGMADRALKFDLEQWPTPWGG